MFAAWSLVIKVTALYTNMFRFSQRQHIEKVLSDVRPALALKKTGRHRN
jgi:hypothetical protein